MRRSYKKTAYPGVFTTDQPGTFRVEAKVRDPRTGRRKQIERHLTSDHGVKTARDASRVRQELIAEAQRNQPSRMNFRERANQWLALRVPVIDGRTAENYAGDVGHLTHALGDLYPEEILLEDVQAAVNQWAKTYSRGVIKNRLARLATMLRDWELPNVTARVMLEDDGAEKPENRLTESQLGAVLVWFKEHAPQHFAIVAFMAVTGLRWCHASALRWEDIDEIGGAIRIERKNARGRIGKVTRKKRAPKRIPLIPELAELLRQQRVNLVRQQMATNGWCFPDRNGGLRHGSTSLKKAWPKALKAAKVTGRVTPHGLRYTFNDLVRRKGTDPLVIRAITGHVTEAMREHYSHVGMDEQATAIGGVVRLVRLDGGLDRGGKGG